MESKKPKQIQAEEIPRGFTLRHTLCGHTDTIRRIAWSPDGTLIASASSDRAVRVWRASDGNLVHILKGHQGDVFCLAFSPDGSKIASAGAGGAIHIWDALRGSFEFTLRGHVFDVWGVSFSPDGELIASASDDGTVRVWRWRSSDAVCLYTLEGHLGEVWSVAFWPDGSLIASGSTDQTILVWRTTNGSLASKLHGHSAPVFTIVFSADDSLFASSSVDGTVRIWDANTCRQKRILDNHLESAESVSFSSDCRLLASKSLDGTVRVWRCDRWETVAILKEKPYGKWHPALAFHPKAPILATLGDKNTVIRIWDVDLRTLLNASPSSTSVHYSNAKVVLVGDTGVGKSALGRALSGQIFVPTESTHGRRVWTFDIQEIERENGQMETRETLLWDLAGQPGYRLIHQLHLSEVVVALVVFDARSETDPLAGVRHWDRALRQAQEAGSVSVPLKKYLVAARADRGGVSVSRERINAMIRDMGFAGYFETSAKEGWQIQELVQAIHNGIDWSALPKVSSNELFHTIKQFLLDEKESGRLLENADELYQRFCQTHAELFGDRDLRAEFDTCIGRVEGRGLIRRLNFGGFVLLQPELFDAYASAMVNVAKSEPDGLGFISEESALAGQFVMPKDERVIGKEQEKLLLIATVEELLRYEVALREEANEDKYLVFPSQFNRDWPDAPDPQGKALVFRFDGPVLNIYATLVVRLAHSGRFETGRMEMWRNAVKYIADGGGACGVYLREVIEGQGELTLFFDEAVGEETRLQFEEFIALHLQRRALPQTVVRRRIFVCGECKTTISDEQVQHRRARGKTTIDCPVCDNTVSLLDRDGWLNVVVESTTAVVAEMDRNADKQRDKVRPGDLWQEVLEKQIKKIKTAAIFIGPKGSGPWQLVEQMYFIDKVVKQKGRLIPIVLEGGNRKTKVPVTLKPFLSLLHCVDFSKTDPDPLVQLVWGITGEREESIETANNKPR